MTYQKIILRKGKEDAVKRCHPWIFSGAIDRKDANLEPGELVEVLSYNGEFLALGYHHDSSITVKILSFVPTDDLTQLFTEKIKQAYNLRKTIGLIDNSHTNCYRLINSEGDGIPGLIVDIYNESAVFLCYHQGIYRQRQLFAQILQDLLGDKLRSVFDKSSTLLPGTENAYLFGTSSIGEVKEHDLRFLVDWENGQKTGFFLDQRENRQRLLPYIQNKTVLNTFCYSGGFSVYALTGGASLVHSVDISAKAIGWALENVALNPATGEHQTNVSDIFNFLKTTDRLYDVIILDPPAFAKNLSSRHQAVLAYKRLHQLAFDRVTNGGIIFTFSCSQVVSVEQFVGAVTAAAIESGKQVKILERLHQPADHPCSIFHSEGSYLKGLVLSVE